MRRPIIGAMILVGMAALSCHFEAAEANFVGPRARAPEANVSTPVDLDVEHGMEILAGRHTGLASWEHQPLAREIVEQARLYDLEPTLVFAVIQVESGWYSHAVSPVGALGLMQLLPSTAEELAGELGIEWRGADTLFDPIANVRLGVAYLRQLTDRYESVPTALAAYNWGPGRIDRRLRRGAALPEIYVRQVMETLEGVRRS